MNYTYTQLQQILNISRSVLHRTCQDLGIDTTNGIPKDKLTDIVDHLQVYSNDTKNDDSDDTEDTQSPVTEAYDPILGELPGNELEVDEEDALAQQIDSLESQLSIQATNYQKLFNHVKQLTQTVLSLKTANEQLAGQIEIHNNLVPMARFVDLSKSYLHFREDITDRLDNIERGVITNTNNIQFQQRMIESELYTKDNAESRWDIIVNELSGIIQEYDARIIKIEDETKEEFSQKFDTLIDSILDSVAELFNLDNPDSLLSQMHQTLKLNALDRFMFIFTALVNKSNDMSDRQLQEPQTQLQEPQTHIQEPQTHIQPKNNVDRLQSITERLRGNHEQ